MFTWTRTLLGCGLTIAALFGMPLVPQAISQESQQHAAPLKDVCREGWSRYECNETRACVSPEVVSQYDLAASTRWGIEGCSKTPTQLVLPEAWTHATPEEIGYLTAAFRWRGYDFRYRVVNFDSSMIKNGDLEGAIRELFMERGLYGQYPYFMDRFNEGRAKYQAHEEVSLDSYNIKPPSSRTPVTDVCPEQWSRFSCQFVRLCVSPTVAAKYDLVSSEEFKYARCKADNRSVPEGDTHFSPHDVGEGALLVDRVYFKAVKLDSSDIFEGDIEEAIERLVLVPIPSSALIEYDRGYEVGLPRFKRSVAKTSQKYQKQSEDATSPHQ